MIEWIIKLLQNFTVYKLGWFSKGFTEMMSNHDDWNDAAIIILVVICVIIATNIIYFLHKFDEVYLKVYIPLCFTYILQNIIFHLFLACLFSSLGPVMWIILSCIYLVFLVVYSIFTVDEYEDLPGMFKLILFVVQYSKKYKDYANHKKIMLNNYQKFLNIKYE
ncbi:MAG: hypothetical protein WC554_09145 [Clostridia bacterium]